MESVVQDVLAPKGIELNTVEYDRSSMHANHRSRALSMTIDIWTRLNWNVRYSPDVPMAVAVHDALLYCLLQDATLVCDWLYE